jgi:hypothetical protein
VSFDYEVRIRMINVMGVIGRSMVAVVDGPPLAVGAGGAGLRLTAPVDGVGGVFRARFVFLFALLYCLLVILTDSSNISFIVSFRRFQVVQLAVCFTLNPTSDQPHRE